MDFFDLVKTLRRSLHNIILAGLFLGFLGALTYFVLPPRYVASGTLYVTRTLERPDLSDGDNVFLYEGFYASQNAQAYTASLIGILQSRDIHSKVLTDIQQEINNKNLKTIRRSIKISKQTPQLISLQTKGNTPVSAEGLWGSLVNNLEEFNKDAGRASDPNLRIVRVAEKPVVLESFRNIYLNFIIGASIGLLGATSWYVLKESFSSKK